MLGDVRVEDCLRGIPFWNWIMKESQVLWMYLVNLGETLNGKIDRNLHLYASMAFEMTV